MQSAEVELAWKRARELARREVIDDVLFYNPMLFDTHGRRRALSASVKSVDGAANLVGQTVGEDAVVRPVARGSARTSTGSAVRRKLSMLRRSFKRPSAAGHPHRRQRHCRQPRAV